MSNFVDFVAAAAIEDGNNLGNDLVAFLKKVDKAEELEEWFKAQKNSKAQDTFSGVSLDDCKKILENREGLIKYGDLISVKNGY